MTADADGEALLDNLFWNALTGKHAHFGVGTDEVRRYAPGFPPLAAFADAKHPRLDQLASLIAPREQFYCDGWSGPAPAGWQVLFEGPMTKMIWRGPSPANRELNDFVRLGPQHVPQILPLVELTRPGPFGPRNLEMGEYIGLFDGEGESRRLIAMAGERSAAGTLREISAVCTHPDMQGKGLARQLMLVLIARQMARGETPVLHVLSRNDAAIGLYRRMGFAEHFESVVRVIARD